MNDSLQQPDQTMEAPLETTEQVSEVVQEDVNNTENNADNQADSLENHLDAFDKMYEASQEAANTQPQQPQASEAQPPQEQPAAEAPRPDVDNSPPDNRVDHMWENFQKDARRKSAEDVDNAVKTVKSSSPVLEGVSDYIVKGAVDEMARRDPRIGRAFTLRHEDPKLWNETLTQLSKQIARDFSVRPDENASNSVAAIRKSVNSQSGGESTSGPSDSDIANMSDAQFARYKREMFQ